MHKQQGWLQAWEYCQAKLIQTLVRASQGVDWSSSQCIKSHHAQTSSGKGLPSHFWTRDNVRSVLPGLWRKRTQWSKVLFSDESEFCISFGNQGPRVWRKSGEAQNPCCLKSSVKFPQSVMIWAAMSSAGVGPLCFLKSTVNAAIYQEILEHFMLPSADKLYGDADFIFQQDLAPAHTAKGTKSWFNDHGITVLDWPANSPDLNPIENLWGIVKRKTRDTRPNNADELKATVKETWASIPPQQCHKLITSMPRRIEAVIKAGLQTATKTVAFATKNINLRVKFLLRSPLATIYIYMLWHKNLHARTLFLIVLRSHLLLCSRIKLKIKRRCASKF